jgi:hypothetical protein
MAITTTNIITRATHGRMGNVIFRSFAGKTVMSAVPDYSIIRWSNLQKKNRMRFRDAMVWARRTLSDPVKYSYYQKKAKPGQTVWNAALSDYLTKPQITGIDVSNYRGHMGDTIRIKALDKFRVASVMVTIIDATGQEVESCMAMQKFPGDADWYFMAREKNQNCRGGRVVVRVTNSPGNVVQASQVL